MIVLISFEIVNSSDVFKAKDTITSNLSIFSYTFFLLHLIDKKLPFLSVPWVKMQNCEARFLN